MSEKVFWYEKNGKKHGGYTAAELKALALSGEIDSSCLIWKEGARNWIPAASAKGLLPPEPTPAPPQDSISPINEPPPEVEHAPTNESPKKNSIMKNSGFVLVFIAAICVVSALLMDTSVATDSGSRVHNIGLMSLQTNLLIGGGFAFISAIVLILFSSKSELSDTNKKCPYCAEIIKREAVICKYCGKEQAISNQEREEINKAKEASEKSIQRFKSIGLFIGILLMPYIFSFVTLKKKFSKKIRVASFLYLFIFLCLLFSFAFYTIKENKRIEETLRQGEENMRKINMFRAVNTSINECLVMHKSEVFSRSEEQICLENVLSVIQSYNSDDKTMKLLESFFLKYKENPQLEIDFKLIQLIMPPA